MHKKSMSAFLRIIFISMLMGMSGCAVMDKSDCTNANWQNLGKTDALAGEYSFAVREKSCKKHGLSADKSAYDRGAQEGLIGFCTAASGRHHGLNGGAYARGFCPSNTESEFLSGYTPAHQKYTFQKRISDMQENISKKKELLSEASHNKIKSSADIEMMKSEIKRLEKELQMQMYIRVLN